MKSFVLHIFGLLLAMAIAVTPADAAVTSVSAKLDSVQLLMGNLTTLRLEVVKDAKAPGGFTMFSAPSEAGYVGVCGDSIELRTSIKCDTVEIGSGRIQLNYQIPLQAFDSGTYQLPAFVYVSGVDTARSNRLSLKVVPLHLTADDPIAGFAPVAEPEGKSVFDFLPDFIVDFWWLIIAIIALIAAFIWAMKRYRKQGTILPKKPEPSPYEVAMAKLRELKEKGLWEKGMEKEYFTDLTEILRVYLDKRFNINAMEMTSRQIMDTLRGVKDISDKRDYVRQILNVADFVKFAKVRPLPADNIAAFDNAVKFVEETKPVPTAVEEPVKSADNDSLKTKHKKGGSK